MRPKISLLAATFLIIWSVGFSFAAEVAGQDADKELQKLQGAWVMVSGEKDGKPAADEHVAQSKLSYKGKEIQIFVPNQTGEMIVADLVEIDPAKNPKEIHFIRRNGPSAGKTLIAIYEFTGDDNYKFAFDPSGKETLKEFATKPGTGHILNTWKRVKP
jgi:uncharacterized protein (TIGR03067 family)